MTDVTIGDVLAKIKKDLMVQDRVVLDRVEAEYLREWAIKLIRAKDEMEDVIRRIYK